MTVEQFINFVIVIGICCGLIAVVGVVGCTFLCVVTDREGEQPKPF